MLRLLRDGDEQARTAVLANLLPEGTSAEEALPLLRAALGDPAGRVRWLALAVLQRLGGRLTEEQAARLERATEDHPGDAALRLLLLGHYFLPSAAAEPARRARQRHALWLIQHAPQLASGPHVGLYPGEDGQAYERARRLWLGHVEARGRDPALLAGAADFFARPDPALSAGLLRRARALEPGNPEWARRLACLYDLALGGLDPDARRERAALALAEYEAALGGRRGRLLADLARLALEAGAWDKARAYATELLGQAAVSGSPPRGDAAHHGHLVLGRLALRQGDVGSAKAHLLAAGSAALSSSGPGMALAKELLEAGERAAVVEYLRLCASSWHTEDRRAERWAEAVERGGMPDFGANLSY
jgi:hypothetical protein